MIKALNPDAWCFITMFDNINPLSALIDPLAKRMQQAEERRINLIKELITDHCKNFSMLFQEITLPDNFKTTYIIFFGGFII
jgi:alanyl-tRNA synthetase